MTTTQDDALEQGGYQGDFRGGLGRTRNNHTTTPLSTAKQRLAILDYLVAGNRLTTLHARDELGIMHPAARILELRNDGYNIVTHKRTDQDASGTKHSVAEYVLMNG